MQTDLAMALAASREFLVRQVRGLSSAECDYLVTGMRQTINQIVDHMLANDAFCMDKLGAQPYVDDPSLSADQRLTRSGLALQQEIRRNWSDKEDEALLRLAGGGEGIAKGVSYIQIEDFYHAGQACWIRLALQPEWDSDADTYEPFP
jgi:hypothetical protein